MSTELSTHNILVEFIVNYILVTYFKSQQNILLDYLVLNFMWYGRAVVTV